MEVSASLHRVIAKIEDLPAMPDVVQDVLTLTDDPGVAVSDVCERVEQDPALAAKLLKVSNSAYYGMRQVVGTLKLALVILGVREVRNIVLGVSVLDSLKNENTNRLLKSEGLWTHSVATAGLTKKLSEQFALECQGEDFVAGLLHDVGKLVLWNELGREYVDIYTSAKGQERSLYTIERESLGFDHADVAAALAEHWSLPDTLRDALWFHHPREGHRISEAKDPALAALVRLANLAVRDEWRDDEPIELLSLKDVEAWEVLDPMQDLERQKEMVTLVPVFLDEVETAGTLAID